MRIIGGRHRGRNLATPRGLDTRPPLDHQRETIFNILGPVTGARVADLFAGSGSFGLEALSRGATSCIFYERDRRALDALRTNIASIEATDSTTISTGDAFAFPAGHDCALDVLFIDPPYTTLTSPGGMARFKALVDAVATCMAPGGVVVFRIPTGTGLASMPAGASDQRVRELGKSRVYFVHYPAPDDAPDDASDQAGDEPRQPTT